MEHDTVNCIDCAQPMLVFPELPRFLRCGECELRKVRLEGIYDEEKSFEWLEAMEWLDHRGIPASAGLRRLTIAERLTILEDTTQRRFA